MKSTESLFFVAIVIGGELGDEITSIKQQIASKYGSKAALRSPPHITLLMPFRRRHDRVDSMIDSLDLIADQIDSFEIQLYGFNCFEPRVIYIDLEPNDSLRVVQDLVAKTFKISHNIFNTNSKNRPFKPHVTVVFRDLSKPTFYKAWEEFHSKAFNASYLVQSISLLRHNGHNWQVQDNSVLKS